MKFKIYKLLLFVRYNILLIIISILVQQDLVASAAKCARPLFPNGIAEIRRPYIHFKCRPKFQLVGAKYARCRNGKWDAPLPVCAKSGCADPVVPENGYIFTHHQGLSVMLYCMERYQVAGQNIAFCNGSSWDRTLGQCRETHLKSALWCDFETADICGWTHDDKQDFEWKRKSGNSNLRLRTGPIADHTTKTSDSGHFMLLEPQNQKTGDRSRLLSPVYSANLNDTICFHMWYYMLGSGVGTLRVYVKPMSIDIDTMVENTKYLYFEISGNQLHLWKKTFFNLEQMNEDFQIVVEGTVANTQLSDIAIDDVALLTGNDCPNEDFKITTVSVEIEDETVPTDIQTCANRCGETESKLKSNESNVLIKNDQVIQICDCYSDCDILQTCCFDYASTCGFLTTNNDNYDKFISEMPTSSTTSRTTASTTKLTIPITYKTTTNMLTIATTKKITTSTLPTIKMPTTTQTTTTLRTRTITKKPNTETSTNFVVPFEITSNGLNRLKITTMMPTLHNSPHQQINDSAFNYDQEFQESNRIDFNKDEYNDPGFPDKLNSTKSLIALFVASIFLIIIVITLITISFRYYRKNYRPENYKNNGEHNGTRNAGCEFSEVRYLTSDEPTLDFTLQQPSNVQLTSINNFIVIEEETKSVETATPLISEIIVNKDSNSTRKKSKSKPDKPKKFKKSSKQSEAGIKLLDEEIENEEDEMFDEIEHNTL